MGNRESDGNTAAKLLARLAEHSARLLHVERAPLPGPAGGRASSALRLVFEVGIVELRPAAAGLAAVPLPPGSAGAGLVPADEDEPWWALLGHPLVRVQARPQGALLVQFRRDEDSPKILVLEPEAGGVAARSLV